MIKHYFDWTATTPVLQNALDEYCRISSEFIGNPSSVHSEGIRAKSKLNELRKRTAAAIGSEPDEIFFTSGGTESDSIIMNSPLTQPVPGHIITTGIEHSAVLEHKKTLENHGWIVTSLNCPSGYINPAQLEKNLNSKTKLVCIMAVNNVTGTVQPIIECVDIIRNFEKNNGRKIHIHCDAVQALGKTEFCLKNLDIDSAAFSSHKFGGPRGIGILFNRNKSINSLSKGGGQEYGLRPGTENLPAIAAMVTALESSLSGFEENYSTVMHFRRIVEDAVLEKGYTLLSPSCASSNRFSPYIITFSVKPTPSEVYIRMMDDKGFCMSSGSACSSNSRGKAESVLSAMNIDPLNRMSAIRVSLSQLNTEQEVKELAKEL